MSLNEENKSILKKFKQIPIYVVEEHNDALKFIYSAIGGKKLPVSGTTLVHLDSHPDMLISRKLCGSDARSGNKLLPLLEIENWIVPAAAAGHIDHVVWLRPPWAGQMADGTRIIGVGDHPETGLLRVDSKEPYYLSDALYSPFLENKRNFRLTVAELGDPNGERANEDEYVNEITNKLNINEPYVLDIDLDFFSTDDPFLDIYSSIDLYKRLQEIFTCNIPDEDDREAFENFVLTREHQVQELEEIFQHLEEHGSLVSWNKNNSEIFIKVKELAELVQSEADRLGQAPDWWVVFAAGCTSDQGGLPKHISDEKQINSMVTRSFRSLLKSLPPPVLITIARSTDDGYCPPDQVDGIQKLVLDELAQAFNTETPYLYYLIST